MGKLIIGFIAGYLLSDIISQKFPSAQRLKLGPGMMTASTTGQQLVASSGNAQPVCAYPTLTMGQS